MSKDFIEKFQEKWRERDSKMRPLRLKTHREMISVFQFGWFDDFESKEEYLKILLEHQQITREAYDEAIEVFKNE